MIFPGNSQIKVTEIYAQHNIPASMKIVKSFFEKMQTKNLKIVSSKSHFQQKDFGQNFRVRTDYGKQYEISTFLTFYF